MDEYLELPGVLEVLELSDRGALLLRVEDGESEERVVVPRPAMAERAQIPLICSAARG